MKNLLVIFLMAFALLSCEGPMGPQGPMGPEGPAGVPGEGTRWQILTYTVDSDHWILTKDKDGLPYYTYDFDEKFLTDDVCEVGTVAGYMFQKLSNGTEVQYTMECNIAKENTAGERWTETYNFDFIPGSIAFNVRYSDFAVKEKPGTIKFRVVLNW